MSTENKISIRKAIEKHPEEAKALTLRNPSAEAIQAFADLCKLDAVFINHNLTQIRYWI